MKQKFIEENYEIIDFEDIADIYVVNTCTVTNMSDRKSRQIIRRAKEKNSKSILVVTGCYAQVAKEELKIQEIDIIIGNQEKKDIISYINKYKKEKQEQISNILYEKEFAEFGTTIYTDKTRAVIKVQDGCDRFCSYCIIHLASYGKECKEKLSLLDLLKQINEISGIERIRLGSLEPTLMEKEFIEELVKIPKICNHFHLSLQSGCNETLTRMNRKYTVEEFEKGIELIRKNYPEVSLTTDIIVGFPGETEEEFEKTYEFLKKVGFYKMHVFPYSSRKGTKASQMPNQISGDIKDKRSKKLIELSNKNGEQQNRTYIGKQLEVLFEEKDGKYIKGHTTNYIIVYVQTEDNLVQNTIKKVKITDIKGEHLIGKLVK